MWMKVDLNYFHNDAGDHGANPIGIPGILYDNNNAVIDTASDFAAYVDAIGLSAVTAFTWKNPCDGEVKSYSRMPAPWYWGGINFNIYPGQGMEITVDVDCVVPLKFGQGYKKHLVCNETVDKYCEWSGQEEFDKL